MPAYVLHELVIALYDLYSRKETTNVFESFSLLPFFKSYMAVNELSCLHAAWGSASWGSARFDSFSNRARARAQVLY